METNKITYRVIEKYIQGKLDEKAMHDLERQALTDPFLADALEGYSHAETTAGPHLSLLQKQLEERIALQEEKKNLFHFGWQRISIAATACLLFIAASILFWMKGSRHRAFSGTERTVEVTLMHPDTARLYSHNYPASKPAGGWKAFDKYLEKHALFKSYPEPSGAVVLTFKVNEAGVPVNIQIKKSGGKELDKEAVRLLEEGPKWEPAKQNRTEIKIDF